MTEKITLDAGTMREAYRKKRALFAQAAIERGSLKDAYADEETAADPKHGRKVIREMRKELGIDLRIPADAPDYVDVFTEILADDPGGAILFEEYLDRLTEMVELAELETAERLASRDELMKNLFAKYYRPEVDPELKWSVTGAFLEYHFSVEMACRNLSYVRTACMFYGEWLVKNIPVDRIVAEKIKEILQKDPEVFPDGMPLGAIPYYTEPGDDEGSAGGAVDFGISAGETMDTAASSGNDGGFAADAEIAIGGSGEPDASSQIAGMAARLAEVSGAEGDYELLLEGANIIRLYMLKHPHQIDAQCLLSVVTRTKDLSKMSQFAKDLDDAIDRYTLSETAGRMTSEQWRALFDGWVMTKSFCRVAGYVLDFAKNYRDATVGEATEALRPLLNKMSYAVAERNIRLTLRQIMLESGIYKFTLSQVKGIETLKTAAGKRQCICLKDAGGDILAALEDKIAKDKRAVPIRVPLDYSDFCGDASFICLNKDEPCGVLLMSEQEEGLVLELAYAKDKLALPSLIWHAYGAIGERFGADQTIFVAIMSTQSATMVERLAPEAERSSLVAVRRK